jgi:hypothetical protein
MVGHALLWVHVVLLWAVLGLYVLPRLPPTYNGTTPTTLHTDPAVACTCPGAPGTAPHARRAAPHGMDPARPTVLSYDVNLGNRTDEWSRFNVLYAGDEFGDVLVRRNLVVQGRVFAADHDGHLRDVGDLARQLNALTVGICEPCVHGLVNPSDSLCRCQCEDGWEGRRCDQHTCGGRDRGTFDRATGTCTCVAPWDPRTYCTLRTCRYEPTADANHTLDVLSPVRVCGPVDLSPASEAEPGPFDDLCIAPGVLGSACSVQCAVPWPDAQLCPRNNLGHSLRPGAQLALNPDWGVCPLVPGSATDAYAHWEGRGLSCGDADLAACQAHWDAYAGVCCAPGMRCDVAAPLCGLGDLGCCDIYSVGADLCAAAGCAWCPEAAGPAQRRDRCLPYELAVAAIDQGICAWTPRSVGLAGTAAADAAAAGLRWRVWPYLCAGDGARPCGASPGDRAALLDLWPLHNLTAGTATADQLGASLASIDARAWRSLRVVNGVTATAASVYVHPRHALGAPAELRRRCGSDGATPPVLAPDPTARTAPDVRLVAAAWVCPSPRALVWLHDNAADDSVFVVSAAGSRFMCLVARLLTPVELAQLSRHGDHAPPLHRGHGDYTAAFALVASADDMATTCGSFPASANALALANQSYGIGFARHRRPHRSDVEPAVWSATPPVLRRGPTPLTWDHPHA